MFRESGLAYGRNLNEFALGIDAASAGASAHVHGRRLETGTAVEHASQALRTADEELQRTEVTLGERDAQLRRLSDQRDELPREFSVPRGMFYLLIAMLLLLGDLTVLAGVLSDLLQLPFRAFSPATAYTIDNPLWVSQLVNDPSAAWILYRSVIVLTGAVLFLGFFPKLYLDLAPQTQSRSFRVAIRVVLVLSILAVALTAVSRYGLRQQNEAASKPVEVPDAAGRSNSSEKAAPTVSPETSETRPDRSQGIFGVASVLLGLALPYVSCFFFAIGADKLGRRIDLWRAAWSRARALRATDTVQKRRQLAADALTAAQLEASKWSLPTCLQEQQALARSEFAEGYADGAVSLLATAGPGGIYTALERIAIRRRLS